MLRRSLFSLTSIALFTSVCLANDAFFLQREVPPLVFKSPQLNPPGLVRWFGDPLRQSQEPAMAQWTADGTKLYIGQGPDLNFSTTALWKTEPSIPGAVPTPYQLAGEIWLRRPLAVSRDGRFLVGHDRLDHGVGSTLTVYDADTLKALWVYDDKKIGRQATAVFTQDSKYLVICAQLGQQWQLHVMDAATGEHIRTLPISGSTVSLSACPQGIYIPPYGDAQRRFQLLTYGDWELKAISPPMEEWFTQSLDITDDGRWMILHSRKGYGLFEHTPKGLVMRFVEDFAPFNLEEVARGEALTGVSLAPDGRFIVVSGVAKHKVIRLSDRKTVSTSDSRPLRGTFTPDSRYFLDYGRSLKRISVDTWTDVLDAYTPVPAPIGFLKFSPSGRKIAISGELQTQVWDTIGKQPSALLLAFNIRTVGWSKDENTLFASNRCSLGRWTLPNNPMTPNDPPLKGTDVVDLDRETGHQSHSVNQCNCCINFQIDAEGERGIIAYSKQNTLDQRAAKLLNLTTRNGALKPVTEDLKGLNPVTHHRFSPDGLTIFGTQLGIDGQTLTAYDISSSTWRQKPNIMGGHIVAFDQEGERMLIYGSAGIQYVDARTLEPLESLHPDLDYRWDVGGWASPDGRWLVVTTPGHDKQRIKGPGYAPDSPHHYIALIDLHTKKLASLVPVPFSLIVTGDFMEGGKYFVLGHRNGLASVWSPEKMIQEAPAPEINFLSPLSTEQQREERMRPQGRRTKPSTIFNN